MTQQDPQKPVEKIQGNPFDSDDNPFESPKRKDGSVLSTILLVLLYLFLGIIGIGVLLFAALFVVCMV